MKVPYLMMNDFISITMSLERREHRHTLEIHVILISDTSFFLPETHVPKISTKENSDDPTVNLVVISSTALVFVVVLALVVMLVFCRVRKSTTNTRLVANTTTSHGNVCAVNTDRTYCDSNAVAGSSHLYMSTSRDPDHLTEQCRIDPMQFRDRSNTVIYPLSENYYEPVEFRPPGEDGRSSVLMENSCTSESNYHRVTEDRSSYVKMEI